MLAVLKLTDILANGGSADAGVTLDVHVVTEGENNGLDLGRELTGGGQNEGLCFADGDIDGLEEGNGECGGFTGTGLGLCYDIAALGDGEDSSLLDGGGLFKVWGWSEAIENGESETDCRHRRRGGGPP